MKRTPLRRYTPLRANPASWKKRQSKLKPGKRTNLWSKIRAELKLSFARAEITTCEIRGARCWRDNALGFAHSLKRRNITTEEQWREVCLACGPCHDQIELLPESEMGEIVRRIRATNPIG